MTAYTGIDVHREPPPPADDDHDPRARFEIEASVVTSDREIVTAATSGAVNVAGDDCDSPDTFAANVIRAALGCAAALGTDHHWALVKALRDFGGDPT